MGVDSEYLFLSQAMGMQGSIQDLRNLYFKAAANGTLPSQGGGGGAGANGKSAYELAQAGGYGGTQTQWLASLKGEPGAVSTTPGPAGKSAYQSAVDAGFSGTEAQWRASLKGADGAAGGGGSLYTNFADVSLGTGDGTTTRQTIPAGAFTTVQLNAKTSDPNTRFDTTTFLYDVPVTGLYEINARIRAVDGNGAAARNVGIGAHSANQDGPFFAWMSVYAPATTSRTVLQYNRQALFNAGQKIRLFMYSDGGTFPINTAMMTVTFLGAS